MEFRFPPAIVLTVVPLLLASRVGGFKCEQHLDSEGPSGSSLSPSCFRICDTVSTKNRFLNSRKPNRNLFNNMSVVQLPGKGEIPLYRPAVEAALGEKTLKNHCSDCESCLGYMTDDNIPMDGH